MSYSIIIIECILALSVCKIKAKNAYTHIHPSHSSHKVNVFREFTGKHGGPATPVDVCVRVFSIGKIRILIFVLLSVARLLGCFVCFMLV